MSNSTSISNLSNLLITSHFTCHPHLIFVHSSSTIFLFFLYYLLLQLRPTSQTHTRTHILSPPLSIFPLLTHSCTHTHSRSSVLKPCHLSTRSFVFHSSAIVRPSCSCVAAAVAVAATSVASLLTLSTRLLINHLQFFSHFLSPTSLTLPSRPLPFLFSFSLSSCLGDPRFPEINSRLHYSIPFLNPIQYFFFGSSKTLEGR